MAIHDDRKIAELLQELSVRKEGPKELLAALLNTVMKGEVDEHLYGKRQKSQLLRAFRAECRGEAPSADGEGTEPPAAWCDPQRPAATEHLMQAILPTLMPADA